jgi:hypothetical protein
MFSASARSALRIPCEENFILAKNLPLDGTTPDSSLFSLEGLLAIAHWAKHFGLPGLPGANLRPRPSPIATLAAAFS